MPTKIGLLLLSVLLIIARPAQTQTDTASPLLDMLALVPDNESVRRAIVSYADYRSIEATRGIETPTINDLRSTSDLSLQWQAAIQGLASGMQEYRSRSFVLSEETPEVIGFAFNDIDRSLRFGFNSIFHGMASEIYGLLLAGDFDNTRITNAFIANEFAQNDFNGINVLCHPNGCDRGREVSPEHQIIENPFGGHIGRRQPLALLPGILVSSPIISTVEDVLATYRDKQPALADAPDYRAIALATASQGNINQIEFVNPQHLMPPDPETTMLNADQIERLYTLTRDFDMLPSYSLAAIADVWDGNQQRALIMLAYPVETDAQAATHELARRMETFAPPSSTEAFSEQLNNIDAVVNETIVYADTEARMWVVIWSMYYPVPANETQNSEPLVASSQGYDYLMNAFYRRELYVLVQEPMQSE